MQKLVTKSKVNHHAAACVQSDRAFDYLRSSSTLGVNLRSLDRGGMSLTVLSFNAKNAYLINHRLFQYEVNIIDTPSASAFVASHFPIVP